MIVLDYKTFHTLICEAGKHSYFASQNLVFFKDRGQEPSVPGPTFLSEYEAFSGKVDDYQILNKLYSLQNDVSIINVNKNQIEEAIKMHRNYGDRHLGVFDWLAVAVVRSMPGKATLGVMERAPYKGIRGIKFSEWWKKPPS